MEQNLVMPKLTTRNPTTKFVLWKGPLGRPSSAKHSHTPTLTWNGRNIGIDRRRINPNVIGSFGMDRKITKKAGEIYIGKETNRKKQMYWKNKRAASFTVKENVKRLNEVIKLLEGSLKRQERTQLTSEMKKLREYLKIRKEVNFADRKTRDI